MNINRIDQPLYKSIMSIGLLMLPLIGGCSARDANSKNGFDLSNATIDREEILFGGPGKDGIPAIDNPVFVAANQADFMQDQDRVLALEIDTVAKAYPIKILNWHEIVNDRIGDKSFAVTYCPLCGTGVVFSSHIDNQVVRFGVSGLLYNSDVLLYDDKTESLFSQILSRAISGPLAGRSLQTLLSTHTTWGSWRQMHPQTLVLSTDTGYPRDYTRNPYGNYNDNRLLYFPVNTDSAKAHDFHPKESVLGLIDGDTIKAYPFSELDRQAQAQFEDVIQGKTYTIEWDSQNKSAQVRTAEGRVIPTLQGFYFAWMAFYPESLVFRGFK